MCICLQSILSDSKRQKEIESKMFTILSELIRYAVFMYLVLLMAYARRDNNIFYNNQFMKHHNLTTVDATYFVKTPLNMLDFIEKLIENGLYDNDTDGFFNEGHAFFVQEPRLRQFRVVPTLCEAPKIFGGAVRCIEKLGPANLDTMSYGLGWSTDNTSQFMGEWVFEHAHEYHAYKGSACILVKSTLC